MDFPLAAGARPENQPVDRKRSKSGKPRTLVVILADGSRPAGRDVCIAREWGVRGGVVVALWGREARSHWGGRQRVSQGGLVQWSRLRR